MSTFLTSKNIIEKQTGETLNIAMEFENWLDTGVTISNPNIGIVPDDSILEITNVNISGSQVTMTASSGVVGQRYRLSVTVDTSESEILIGDGILKIRDR